MRQGNIGHRLDLCYLQDSLIRLPLPKSIERIVVGVEVLRHHLVASNGLIEHPAERDTIDHSGLDAEPNDPVRVLIHDDQGTSGALCRPIVTGENPLDTVFVDWDVESQGNLLSNSRTARGIVLFCLENGFNNFSGRSLWTGPASSLW